MISKLLLEQEDISPNLLDNCSSGAAEVRCYGVVKLLSRREDANPSLPDNGGTMPLSLATEKGRMGGWKLLEAGRSANPNAIRPQQHLSHHLEKSVNPYILPGAPPYCRPLPPSTPPTGVYSNPWISLSFLPSPPPPIPSLPDLTYNSRKGLLPVIEAEDHT